MSTKNVNLRYCSDQSSPPLLQEPLSEEDDDEESSTEGSSDQACDGVVLPTETSETVRAGNYRNPPCIACSREYPDPCLMFDVVMSSSKAR